VTNPLYHAREPGEVAYHLRNGQAHDPEVAAEHLRLMRELEAAVKAQAALAKPKSNG
jgi:hypothetical protein